MSTLTKMTRTVKKLEVPRPLKSNTTNNRNSLFDIQINSVEDLIGLSEAVACQITQGSYERTLQSNIATMYQHLKLYGAQLESLYKDLLDRFFVVFRNGSQDENLDKRSRLHLLELIELRAKHWQGSDYMSHYYKHRVLHEPLLVPTMDSIAMSGGNVSPTLATPPIDVPTILGPGEIIKTSGKFIKPTKIPGKNYSKDEVVIRNADSGKVMGIKGRRVHMIEELSDTIISFQRVSPGAKERLVQITGPNEENVNHAKHLIGDTIRRNASPVRLEQGVTSTPALRGSANSLNSTASDEGGRPVLGIKDKGVGGMPGQHNMGATSVPRLLHSLSTSDAALGEYKYTVTVGNDLVKITGLNLDLVRTSKLVLDEFYENLTSLEREGSGDFFTLSRATCNSLLDSPLPLALPQESYTPLQLGGAGAPLLPLNPHMDSGLSHSPTPLDDDVFASKPSDENGTEQTFRRPRFSHSASTEKKEGSGKQTYSYEVLLQLAESPRSRQAPRIEQLPAVISRKACMMFDGAAYLKKIACAPMTDLADEAPHSPEP